MQRNRNIKLILCHKFYRYLKLVFFFVSTGEHLPVHIHVSDEDDNQSIFDLIIEDEVLVDIKVRKKAGFKPISTKNQGIVKSFIRMYYAQIVAKWVQHFILNKQIKIETIKKIDNLTVDAEQLVSHLSNLNRHFYPTEKKQSKTEQVSKSKKK